MVGNDNTKKYLRLMLITPFAAKLQSRMRPDEGHLSVELAVLRHVEHEPEPLLVGVGHYSLSR